jgi:alanine racemase
MDTSKAQVDFSKTKVISQPQARCWADIDLAALERNLRRIKAGLPGNLRHVAVVKADAYGHGIHPVVSRLIQCGADLFAVANVSEGAQIREIGSGWPTLVLSPVLPGEEYALLDYDLIATVSTEEEAMRFDQFARRNSTRLPIHIKIDTGMGRSGVWHEEASGLLETIESLQHLEIQGLYTHFSDATEHPEFTELQRENFLRSTAGFRKKHSGESLLIHADSSSSLESLSGDSPENAVRIGLLQYGVPPNPNSVLAGVEVEPVLSFYTKVGLVKNLPAGTAISYGRTHVLGKDSTIAVLTGGYGDGIPLDLSNCGEVLIRGTRLPILGRVTMDQTIVDASSLPSLEPGETATLIGKDQREEITLTDFARQARSIPYEILCSITKRVQRIYRVAE